MVEIFSLVLKFQCSFFSFFLHYGNECKKRKINQTPTSQLVNTKQLLNPILLYAFCSTYPHPHPHSPLCPTLHPPLPQTPSPRVKQVTITLSQLERAKCMRNPYAPVSGITKRRLQLMDKRSENVHINPRLL